MCRLCVDGSVARQRSQRIAELEALIEAELGYIADAALQRPAAIAIPTATLERASAYAREQRALFEAANPDLPGVPGLNIACIAAYLGVPLVAANALMEGQYALLDRAPFASAPAELFRPAPPEVAPAGPRRTP